jgi:hypothetical protein
MVRFLGPLLAGLIVGALLGAGGFWLFGDSGNAAATSDAPRTERPRAPRDDGPAEAGAVAPVAAERTIARPDATVLLPREVSETMTALAHAVPTPSVERGTKALSGHVTDPQGKPLAGVLVRAARQKERKPERPKRGEELTPQPTLEQRLREAVTAHYQTLADQRETTSDGDGAWRFDELVEGDWRVSAGKAGFAFTTAREVVKPDAVVDFRASLVIRVPIAVRMPDGKVPDEAALVFIGDRRGGRRPEGWSADTPWIALEPGSYELKATLGDPEVGPPFPVVLASESQTVTVRSEAPPAEVVFTLKGTPGICGRIKQTSPEPESDLFVRLMPLPLGKDVDLNALAGSNKQARCDGRDGTFVFKDLSAGRYLIGVTRSWNPPVFANAVVVVADAMVTQDLDLPPLEAAQCIVAHVFSPEGLAVEKADFLFAYKNKENNWSSNVYATHRGPGTYWVVSPKGDGPQNPGPWGMPDTNVELTAHCTQYGSKSVAVSGPGREVDIKFGEPATLVVSIPGYVGSGFEGRIHLAVEEADGPQQHQRYWNGNEENAIGTEGKQSFGPLEAGDVRVVMTIQNEGQSWGPSTRAGQIDVHLRPGENAAFFPIPPLYSLVVEVPNGKQSTSVQLSMVGEGGESEEFNNYGGVNAQLDAQGRATFSALAAGTYVLNVWGEGEQGQMRIRVPAGGTVRYQPQVNDCLVVWVNGKEGKLGKAGFENNDKVIAIAGTPLRDVKTDLEAIVTANATKEAVSFTVLRSGKTLELTFDLKAMLTPDTMGGWMQPGLRE